MSRYDRGRARLAELGGSAEALAAPLAGVAPDLARFVVEFALGDLHTRPGLDLRQRQMLTVAALVTLGDTDPQLRFHLRAALAVGCSPEQLTETLLHLLPFAGFPRVVNATAVLSEVLAAAAAPPG